MVSCSPRRLLTAAALTAVATIAVPAAADAAYTSAVTGGDITMTGDTADDVLNITVDGPTGELRHNRAADPDFNSAADFVSGDGANDTKVLAAATVGLTVNAGDGTDAVNAILTAAQLQNAALNGEGGDDTLISGASTDGDVLTGGIGNDRLVGGPGADTLNGEAGNDQLVWNNGDGSDTMNGGDNNDEVEVNGSTNAGDAFTVNPGPAGRVDFDRTNLIAFSLDIGTSERMTVNGNGGADAVTGGAGIGALILLTVNGGPGADAITGGDGPDLLNGGEDADAISGGDGADRVAGDRGGDALAGGPGDDTLVWNNGDGSDTMDGEGDVDRVEVNGSPGAAGDVFTFAPAAGGRMDFDRTNLVAFSLDIGTAEALDVRGLGGDDQFTAADGVIPVLADGGSGNDTLTGASEPDTFLGDAGNDTITGGAGNDLLDGMEGDDQLFARDDAGDLARCGSGSDKVEADGPSQDVVSGDCEAIDRLSIIRTSLPPITNTVVVPGPTVQVPGPAVQVPAASAPTGDIKGTVARLADRTKRVVRRGSRRRVTLSVSCPASEAGGCTGELTLTTRRAVNIGGIRLIVELGSAEFSLRAGQSRSLTISLPSRIARFAGSSRSLAARATILNSDAAGNAAIGTQALSLQVR